MRAHGLRLMTPDREALRDLELCPIPLLLGGTVGVQGVLLLELLPSLQIATTGDEPVVDPHAGYVMLPASMASSLFSNATSSDAVLAPTPIGHVRDTMLCYVRGARLGGVGADFQVRRLLLGLDLSLALVAFLARFVARLLRLGLGSRGDHSILHLVHHYCLWTSSPTSLVVWCGNRGLTGSS